MTGTTGMNGNGTGAVEVRTGERPPMSLVGAAAYLGVSPSRLRHLLERAGHRPTVGENGRAYLPVALEEADRLLRRQAEVREAAQSLPGWSDLEVARQLGIQRATVHRLRQLGKLPAEIPVPEGLGNRRWRWDPATVRAYAKRVGRTLAGEPPLE